MKRKKRKKKDKTSKLLLKLLMHPKGSSGSGMIPLAAFGPLIPQSAVLTDPNGSQGWDVRQMRSHARVQRCEIVSFSPFLCLPVILKLNGLPQAAKDSPSFPPEKRWATAHSCTFYPGYHVAKAANHSPAFSGFQI